MIMYDYIKPDYSSSGSQLVRASPGSSGPKAGASAEQDTVLSQSPSQFPSLTQTGTMRYPNVHTFRRWEETRVPCTRGEMCKLHTVSAPVGTDFFSNQNYN